MATLSALIGLCALLALVPGEWVGRPAARRRLPWVASRLRARSPHRPAPATRRASPTRPSLREGEEQRPRARPGGGAFSARPHRPLGLIPGAPGGAATLAGLSYRSFTGWVTLIAGAIVTVIGFAPVVGLA